MTAYLLAVLGGIPLCFVAVPFGIGVYLVAVSGGALWLVAWHAANTAFRCPHCETVFAVPMRVLLITPHMGSTKLLPCPGCRRAEWCEAVGRDRLGPESPAAPPPLPEGEPSRSVTVQMWIVLAASALLWANTAVVTMLAPVERGPLLLVAAGASILPLLAVPFYRFAARYGLRSAVYPFVTGLLVFTLLLIGGTQYLVLAV